MVCRVCFASLVGALAQAARKPQVRGFHAETLVRPLLRMARYVNSEMQSAAFLALGHLMSYPAAQQVVCEVRNQNTESPLDNSGRFHCRAPLPNWSQVECNISIISRPSACLLQQRNAAAD
jgi:hypothetical protein